MQSATPPATGAKPLLCFPNSKTNISETEYAELIIMQKNKKNPYATYSEM